MALLVSSTPSLQHTHSYLPFSVVFTCNDPLPLVLFAQLGEEQREEGGEEGEEVRAQ